MQRAVFAETVPAGDYALSTSGLTWNVDRMTSAGNVLRLIAGESTRVAAMERLLAIAERDGCDAWERLGPAAYKLVKRGR